MFHDKIRATGSVPKKIVLKYFAKFTGRHLCRSHFFNKVAGLQPARLKETPPQVFSCEFCEISKNTFHTEHLRTIAFVRCVDYL